uniref:GB1/RHD3-type G domain-containing protein n=2 Tax=Octactis speculum TaxID=3111310 RepID=A0A7S2D5P0_9STRA|mmetsp:Transcript_43254/g.59120  ORF Transcript_43254/g.59120 Transcript_43254/m.59120 type:complete len:345 (+) Transcript_43254:62-1096(+)
MALSQEEEEEETDDTGADGGDTGPKQKNKAFQRLEFLVRDWPNFDDEGDESAHPERLEFMDKYIHDVVRKQKSSGDLQETRDQITSCFDNISCFLLPHPGLKIQKSSYTGDIDKIEDDFRDMLTLYMNHIFNVDLKPKEIDGRALTASELGVFTKTYVDLFKDGASFPEAKTVLQATAEANNNNALSLAYKKFMAEMDVKFGPRQHAFVQHDAFEEYTLASRKSAIAMFTQIAHMGSKKNSAKFQATMLADIDEQIERFRVMNESRNPWQGAEQYIVPVIIAVIAYVGRYFAKGCAPISSVCHNTQDFLGHIYVGIATLMLIVSAGRIQQGLEYARTLTPLFSK